MPVVPAAEIAGRTRYSPEAQRLVVEALGMPAGDAKGAACVAARDALRRELLCCGKRPSEHALMGRVVRVTGPYEAAKNAAAVKMTLGHWWRIIASLRRGMATLRLGHKVLGMRRAAAAKKEASRIAAVWLTAAKAEVAESQRRRAQKEETEAVRDAAPLGRRTRGQAPLPAKLTIDVACQGLVDGRWRRGIATIASAKFAYFRDDGEEKFYPDLLDAAQLMPLVDIPVVEGDDDDDDDVEEEPVPVRVRATEASFQVVDVRPADAADVFKLKAAKLRASRPKPATVLEDAGLEAPPYIALNRDSEGKLAGGLIENAPEFLQHKEHNSPWWWTRKMLLEAG